MQRRIRQQIHHLLLLISMSVIGASCNDSANPFNAVGVGVDDTGGNRSGNSERAQNSWESIDQLNYGRVLLFSPTILEKDPSRLNPEMNIARYLSDPVFITDSPILQRGCPGDLSGTGAIEHCFESSDSAGAPTITPNNGRWAFEVDTSEFDQVQTFYHVGGVVDYYLKSLSDLYYYQAQPAVDLDLITTQVFHSTSTIQRRIFLVMKLFAAMLVVMLPIMPILMRLLLHYVWVTFQRHHKLRLLTIHRLFNMKWDTR